MTLTETAPLQLILPTDRRNPSFSLYLSADEQAIHVIYGLELLEIVPADREHVAYRMLVARLYNAGLRVRTLAEVFQLDPKTMRAWGRALRSRDPALLQRMVLGPGAGRKRTAAIDGYVRRRWPQLLDEGCRNFREKLQQEIQGIFDTRLSGETLRVLMAQIKGSTHPSPPPHRSRRRNRAAAVPLVDPRGPRPDWLRSLPAPLPPWPSRKWQHLRRTRSFAARDWESTCSTTRIAPRLPLPSADSWRARVLAAARRAPPRRRASPLLWTPSPVPPSSATTRVAALCPRARRVRGRRTREPLLA